MSFLLDPGLLVASGVAIETIVPEERRGIAELATIGTFMTISSALYAKVPGLGLFWKPFGSKNGRDFMLNSGVLRFESDDPTWVTHATAASIFATYPLWLKLGRRVGRGLSRRRSRPGTRTHASGKVIDIRGA